MKPQSMSAPLALWLDPETPLSSAHATVLNDTGWAFLGIDTLDGVVQHAAHATVLVLRLQQDLQRLKAVQQLLGEAGIQIPIVCRVDRQALELGVQAAQSGACAVLALDDMREHSWRELQDKISSPSPIAPSAPKVRQVVFVDPVSQHLLALAQKVAQADVTALLVGPTGAGKEVLARVLHEASPRARAPFVALNCAAIPENLIEDMLFGHEKGAFTGAHRDHKGVFEQANGGTLFLDEIGEMPMHLQSKLLRVLQERQLTRLGGQVTIPLNVRFVAATNKDLRKAIAEREFREDLYYRIATFRLTLLPLHMRQGDIIPLALQCLAQHGAPGKPWQISAQAQALLLQYPWPGNVRELENVMRRAVVLCADQVITPAHLMFDEGFADMVQSVTAPLPWGAAAPTSPQAPSAQAAPAAHSAAPILPDASATALGTESPSTPAPQSLAALPTPTVAPSTSHFSPASEAATRSALPAVPTLSGAQDLHSAARLNEHQVIMATLAATPNKTEAAKRLGISPRTLRYKLAQLREMGLGLATAA